LAIFFPTEIEEWVDSDKHKLGKRRYVRSAGIDTVIGSKSGYPITKEFLQAMEKHWFSTP
jgi:hypothetical protein